MGGASVVTARDDFAQNMKIFLIRHASVDYTNDIYRDKYINLSPRGIVQAVEMADLWKHRVDYIYSSDLPRAVQTVAPLSKKFDLSIIEDSALCELDYRGSAALLHQKIMEDRDFKFKGGESIIEANIRFDKAIRTIADEHGTCTVAIGTHGTVLSEFLIKQFGFSNDFFFKLSYPDVYEIQYRDDGRFNFVRRAVEFLPKTSENT